MQMSEKILMKSQSKNDKATMIKEFKDRTKN